MTSNSPRGGKSFTLRNRWVSNIFSPGKKGITVLICHLEHTALTQYSVNKGLQVFVQAGYDAVITAM